MRARRPLVAAGRLAALLLLALPLLGQRRVPATGGEPDFSAHNVPYDGRFTFVRMRYTPTRASWGGGGGFFGGVNYQWDHDYPRAERHFTTLLSELTAIRPFLDGSNILSAADPALFKYPIAYLAEAGFWTVTDTEATNLRNYLLKGGFLIFDDFTGSAWVNFESVLRRVLPAARLVRLDASHPVFHSFFEIASLDHVHPYYGVRAEYYGVFEDNDPAKRLMVMVNYNNDIGESWEWSDTDFIPISLTNEAYKLGVNYVVYALTH